MLSWTRKKIKPKIQQKLLDFAPDSGLRLAPYCIPWADMDRWIQPGDVLELEIEGIGILKNRIVRETLPSEPFKE